MMPRNTSPCVIPRIRSVTENRVSTSLRFYPTICRWAPETIRIIKMKINMDCNNNYCVERCLLFLATFLASFFAHATGTALEQPVGYVEAGANYHHLTS